MFTKSIRWRLQLWLAFLLLFVLSGFGVTIYQLQRVNQLKQIDQELERRVAVLAAAVRGGPPGFGPGRMREGGPGGPGGPGGMHDGGPGGPGGPDGPGRRNSDFDEPH